MLFWVRTPKLLFGFTLQCFFLRLIIRTEFANLFVSSFCALRSVDFIEESKTQWRMTVITSNYSVELIIILPPRISWEKSGNFDEKCGQALWLWPQCFWFPAFGHHETYLGKIFLLLNSTISWEERRESVFARRLHRCQRFWNLKNKKSPELGSLELLIVHFMCFGYYLFLMSSCMATKERFLWSKCRRGTHKEENACSEHVSSAQLLLHLYVMFCTDGAADGEK